MSKRIRSQGQERGVSMCKGPGARESLAKGCLGIDSERESDLGPAQGCERRPSERGLRSCDAELGSH